MHYHLVAQLCTAAAVKLIHNSIRGSSFDTHIYLVQMHKHTHMHTRTHTIHVNRMASLVASCLLSV